MLDAVRVRDALACDLSLTIEPSISLAARYIASWEIALCERYPSYLDTYVLVLANNDTRNVAVIHQRVHDSYRRGRAELEAFFSGNLGGGVPNRPYIAIIAERIDDLLRDESEVFNYPLVAIGNLVLSMHRKKTIEFMKLHYGWNVNRMVYKLARLLNKISPDEANPCSNTDYSLRVDMKDVANVFRDVPADTCTSCKATDVKFMVCKTCRRTKYCSQECQRRDWKRHKHLCKPDMRLEFPFNDFVRYISVT